jgi:hypothetical protein
VLHRESQFRRTRLVLGVVGVLGACALAWVALHANASTEDEVHDTSWSMPKPPDVQSAASAALSPPPEVDESREHQASVVQPTLHGVAEPVAGDQVHVDLTAKYAGRSKEELALALAMVRENRLALQKSIESPARHWT